MIPKATTSWEAAPATIECVGMRQGSWMGHTPPRRVASGTMHKCETPRPKIIPSSSQRPLARRTLTGTDGQRAPQLVGMHVLVPSADAIGYDVFAEDTYDGLPPISCLELEEDLSAGSDESEEIQVLNHPGSQPEAGRVGLGLDTGGPGVRSDGRGQVKQRSLVPRDSGRPPEHGGLKICKREPSQELPLFGSSLWKTPMDSGDRKTTPGLEVGTTMDSGGRNMAPELEETSEVSTRGRLFFF